MDEIVKVTQADRDAAMDLSSRIFLSWRMPMHRAEREAYLSGAHDNSGIVQAFARHRIASQIDT